MINHARTLLLNRPASYYAGVAGAVYIPPEFQPIVETQALKRIRAALIPATVDPVVEIYISDIIMRILHSPDLQAAVLAFDPRITYALGQNTLASITDNRVQMVYSHSEDCDMVPHYKAAPISETFPVGTAGEYKWTLTRVSDYSVQVASNREPSYIVDVLKPGAYQTNMIPLVPNYLSAYLGAPSGKLTGSFMLTYTTVLPPAYNIADRLDELRNLQATSSLFVSNSYAGVLNDLRLLWLNAPEGTVRFGAAVLAYLVQLNTMRSI